MKIFVEKYTVRFSDRPDLVKSNIRKLGGHNGMYYARWLWKVRGVIDRLFGGIGLGKNALQSSAKLSAGDQLGLWVVTAVDANEEDITLKALMNLPGTAMLNFKIKDTESGYVMTTINTFEPSGFWGIIYWYLSLPIHQIIFEGMAKNIVAFGRQ